MKGFYLIMILLFGFLLFSCSSDQGRISYHGKLNQSNQNLAVILKPELFDSFIEMLRRVEEIACHDSIPAIRIKGNRDDKIIGLHNRCMDGVLCILRDVLRIQDDLIMASQPEPLDSLSSYIYQHYYNPNKTAYFSDSPFYASISISYDQHDLSNLPLLLDLLIDHHDALELDVPIKVYLDAVTPPPPMVGGERKP